jgi:hypothetical protein
MIDFFGDLSEPRNTMNHDEVIRELPCQCVVDRRFSGITGIVDWTPLGYMIAIETPLCSYRAYYSIDKEEQQCFEDRAIIHDLSS